MIFQTQVRLYFLIRSKISVMREYFIVVLSTILSRVWIVSARVFRNLFHHSPRTHRTINNRQIDAPLCTSNLKGKIYRVGFFFDSKSKMRGFILRLNRIFGQIFRRLSIRKSGWSGKEGWRGSDDVARVGRHVPRTRDRETELKHHLENVTKKQLGHVFTRVRGRIFSLRELLFYWKSIIVADGYYLSCYPIASSYWETRELKKHSSFPLS